MMAPSPPSSPAPHRNSLLARRGFTEQALTLSFDSIDTTAPSGEDLRAEDWTDDHLARLFDLGISLGSEAASNLADPTSSSASPECHRSSAIAQTFSSPLMLRAQSIQQTSSPCLSDTLLPSPLDSAIGTGFDSAGFETSPSNAIEQSLDDSLASATGANLSNEALLRRLDGVASATSSNPDSPISRDRQGSLF
jgi:hypothetical protein